MNAPEKIRLTAVQPRRRLRLQDRARACSPRSSRRRRSAACRRICGRHRVGRRRRGLSAERRAGARRDDRLLHADRRRPVRLRPHRRDQRHLRRLRDGRPADHGARHRRHAAREAARRAIGAILAGGESVCAAAGIPIAGGHSIDTLEPIYGLVALGLVHPDKVKRNARRKRRRRAGARQAARRRHPLGGAEEGQALGDAATRQMLDVRPRSSTRRARARRDGRRACAHRRHRLRPRRPPARDLPRLEARCARCASTTCRSCRGARWAQQGVATGASERNWKSYGAEVRCRPASPDVEAQAPDRSADQRRAAGRLRAGSGASEVLMASRATKARTRA